jgi:hypothetical protein
VPQSHETVLGAKAAYGHVIGISPAATLKEHVEVHQSPYLEYDVLIFTGMGAMGTRADQHLQLRHPSLSSAADPGPWANSRSRMSRVAATRERARVVAGLSAWKNPHPAEKLGRTHGDSWKLQRRFTGTPSAVCLDIVSTIRTKTLSILLITSLMALMGGPLWAGAPHDVCDRTNHGCARIVPDSCCCGNPADTSPSRVPADRADTVSSPPMAIADVAIVTPPAAALLLHDGPPPLARPPDLWIRFSDYRI